MKSRSVWTCGKPITQKITKGVRLTRADHHRHIAHHIKASKVEQSEHYCLHCDEGHSDRPVVQVGLEQVVRLAPSPRGSVLGVARSQ